MIDTPPETAEHVRQQTTARSAEERFVMAAPSFEDARKMVPASLPDGLTPEEFSTPLWVAGKLPGPHRHQHFEIKAKQPT
ncbi:MAG: hypothetical protein WCH99_16655 [Verrucomicrobiota bacterium]